MKIALAQFNPTVGDLKGNAAEVLAWVRRAQDEAADLVSFPELALTGYPPEDLLLKPQFVSDNLAALQDVAKAVGDIICIVGFVDRDRNNLYNAAAVIHRGKVRGVYHKVFLPNYGVFDEKRYFAAGKTFPVFKIGKARFGVNICEDIWHLEGPAGQQAYQGARLIVNINASPYHIGKDAMRRSILRAQAKRSKVPISYTNLVGGQDELVFDGQSMVIDSRGRVMAQAPSFREQLLVVDLESAASPKRAIARPQSQEEEIYDALVLGLKDYMRKNGFAKVVLGLSGGIDSSLVACIAVASVGKDNVVGVSMPSVFTSEASKEDAEMLAAHLGIELAEVPIQEVFETYLSVLRPVFGGTEPDVTEENLQARIRGNILMALSNKFGYLALNTGNKSEVSCGYCTLYGDMAGGFGVIKDVPKTLVYKLAAHVNASAKKEIIPDRVFKKAPTAELRHGQKDVDTLPAYGLLDKVLRLYVEEDKGLGEILRSGVSKDVASRVLRMVDANEYKRRQAPPGIKITPKAFGRDRRMPITNRYR